MEQLAINGKVQHVGRLTVYVLADGSLVIAMGNIRLQATANEASELVDTMLALRLHTTASSNGHQPELVH